MLDWNKTKTIFIVVFSILNIFLYSLYVKQRTEAQNVPLIGQTSIEEVLKQENITYSIPQNVKTNSSNISGRIISFTKEQLEGMKDQMMILTEGNTKIEAELNTPVTVLNEEGKYIFDSFLMDYVYGGNEYSLWEIDKEAGKALFFQQAINEPIYYSPNAMLIVEWNEEGQVTHYSQKMLEDISDSDFNQKELLTPLEAVGTLATRGYLKQDSKVKEVTLGYSTLVQLTETQVFAPTWNVRVELKDGQIENYFINAVEGKVIDFQLDQPPEVDEEDEAEDE